MTIARMKELPRTVLCRAYWKIVGGIRPIYKEDYERHWGHISFKEKNVLDLGADYGSTAYYFLKKGARKVIAVEGDPKLASKLKKIYMEDSKVICIEKWISCAGDIEELIKEHSPDVVKMDLGNGDEKHLLRLPVAILLSVKEWLVELHSDKFYAKLSDLFRRHGFSVRKFTYKFRNRSVTIVIIKRPEDIMVL
jgi:predicted rRNA methylase YqxC with S4 and FtsJ domains